MPVIRLLADALRRDITQLPATIELSEPQQGGQGVQVRLTKRGPAAVVRLDLAVGACTANPCPQRLTLNARLYPLLNQGVEGLAKSCDAIVFYEVGERLIIFLIELKSNCTSGAGRQIANTRLIAEQLVRHVCCHNRVAVPILDFRGIIFAATSPAIKSGQPAPLPYQDVTWMEGLRLISVRRGEYSLDLFAA